MPNHEKPTVVFCQNKENTTTYIHVDDWCFECDKNLSKTSFCLYKHTSLMPVEIPNTVTILLLVSMFVCAFVDCTCVHVL